jgi:F420-dependent oxidoreductase-like protein
LASGVEIGVFVAPQQGATYDDLLRVARTSEKLGFHAFVRSDHYLANRDVLAPPGPSDAWTTLAALARETSTIRLGTLVSPVTFRPPAILALTVAQVDAMSGGRVLLGLGAGWHEREHTAYGLAFPPVAERFERLGEQLAIVTGLWTTPADERFTFRGRHHVIEAAPALPRPAQRPHPPIVVGGTGRRRTPELAARYAQEFNVPPMHTPAATATLVGRVRAACEERGRDPDELVTSVALTVLCGADEDELAARRARQPDEARIADVSGTPTAVVEQLRSYVEVGARRIYLRLPDLHDVDHVTLLGTEVLPQLVPEIRGLRC